MIGYLEGIIHDVDDHSLILSTGNVGFEIQMGQDPRADWHIGEHISIYTYMNVREDGIELYGFRSKLEKEVFLKLKTVTGIGAKSANNIVSSVTPEYLIQAIVSGNEAAIKKLPGCGPKTTKRIILELKDRFDASILSSFENDTVMSSTIESVTGNQALEDVQEALLVLGYTSAEINMVLSKLDADIGKDTQILLKEALKYLKKS